MYIMYTRYVKEIEQRERERREKGKEWEQIELWQHMRARDSHGAPFVTRKCNATCYSIRATSTLAARARSPAPLCA